MTDALRKYLKNITDTKSIHLPPVWCMKAWMPLRATILYDRIICPRIFSMNYKQNSIYSQLDADSMNQYINTIKNITQFGKLDY